MNIFSSKKAYNINKKLKQLGKQHLNIDNLSMYDFRHSSACYWLPRYKTESSLKHRFGWKKSEIIYYYTEFMGMKDTIEMDDLNIDFSKTELENQIEKEKNERLLLQNQMDEMYAKMEKLTKAVTVLTAKEGEMTQ